MTSSNMKIHLSLRAGVPSEVHDCRDAVQRLRYVLHHQVIISGIIIVFKKRQLLDKNEYGNLV